MNGRFPASQICLPGIMATSSAQLIAECEWSTKLVQILTTFLLAFCFFVLPLFWSNAIFNQINHSSTMSLYHSSALRLDKCGGTWDPWTQLTSI
uniref:Uncharacterized protein n=1 Tax=Ditylenchus dipsaci TaxID=166011 RepID=A0A915CZN7_9BILA